MHSTEIHVLVSEQFRQTYLFSKPHEADNIQDKNTIRAPYIYIDIHPLCGLVVRVPGNTSRGPGSIPGTTGFSEK
jgi:hypothetical protein